MAEIDKQDLIDYLLRLGDSTLVLGQRLSEWCGHAPAIEEDIALTNTALDLIGQARQLLSYAGELEGSGRDEDALAFLRDELEFHNLTLTELDGGDFGRTVLRVLLFAAYQVVLWQALQRSTNVQLAAIAEKSLKESRYHLRYAADWVVRLGDGTEESHRRMQAGLEYLWSFTAELFDCDEVEARLAGVVPASDSLRCAWEGIVLPVLAEATLQVPTAAAYLSRGKYGIHSEALGPLLAEMQFLQRAYPGGNW